MTLRHAFIGVTLLASVLCASADHQPAAPPKAVTPDVALAQLRDGNQRFASGTFQDPRRGQERRCETFSGGQHPVAAVLSCADSRAPAELIFDQGIGDLFVIRVAGNVADTDEIGTLEYGVGHLGIPLIVVLGHGKCGAVTAVVDGAEVHGCIGQLVDNIVPAVKKARGADPKAKGGALVDVAIRFNVQQSIEDMLRRSDTIREAVKSGKVKVVGAVYDLHMGGIEWIGGHPVEAELLKIASGHGATPGQKSDAHAADASAHGAGAPAAHDGTPAKHTVPGTGHAVNDAGHAAPAPAHAAPEKAGKGHEPAHGTPHSKADGPATKPVTASKPHNFMALGGLLVGGGALSAVAIRLIYVKRK